MNEAKAAGRVCISFPISYAEIQHIDRTFQGNVWHLDNGSPSQVGIKGNLVEDKSLRDSISIRDQFTLKELPKVFAIHFPKVKIGVGSKHIYKMGSFMKEHYDSRLPDVDGLPHIMTFIICNSVQELKVNGKYVKILDVRDCQYFGVLFSLDCPHEVLPATWHIRQSFTFPVYGEYKPFWNIPRPVKNFSIYDEVLQHLEGTNVLSDNLSQEQGYIDSLNNPELSKLMNTLRRSNGEYIYDSYYDPNDEVSTTSFIIVEYEDENGVHQESGTEIYLAHAKNLTIKLSTRQEALMKQIKKEITELKLVQQAITYPTVEPITNVNIPDFPFVLVLAGRYFRDSTELVPIDQAIRDYLHASGRTTTFVPSRPIDTEQELYQPRFIFKDNQFVVLNWRLDANTYPISHLDIEFDDAGNWNPKYLPTAGILLVA